MTFAVTFAPSVTTAFALLANVVFIPSSTTVIAPSCAAACPIRDAAPPVATFTVVVPAAFTKLFLSNSFSFTLRPGSTYSLIYFPNQDFPCSPPLPDLPWLPSGPFSPFVFISWNIKPGQSIATVPE